MRVGSLLEQGGWGTYVALLVASGFALVFSMPWAATVKELIWFPWKPTPLVFFAAFAFMTAIVGLNRGAAQAPRGPMQWRQLSRMGGQVLFAFLLCTPYLIYVRALMPGRGPRIPVLVAHAFLVSLVLGATAYVRQAKRWQTGERSSGLHYVFLGLLFGVPLLGLFAEPPLRFVTLLSPAGAIAHILGSNAQPWTAVAFAVPAAVGLVVFAIIGLRMRVWKR